MNSVRQEYGPLDLGTKLVFRPSTGYPADDHRTEYGFCRGKELYEIYDLGRKEVDYRDAPTSKTHLNMRCQLSRTKANLY